MLRQLTCLVLAVAVGSYGASPSLPGPAGLPPTHEQPAPSDNRIVGGINTNIEKYPYQLSFQIVGRHFCGASIISSQWALTSAQCCAHTDTNDLTSITLRAGSSVLGAGGIVYPIERKVKHPLFSALTRDHDVCLLKVSRAFDFAIRTIKAVQLAEAAITVADGSNCNITGWGLTQDGGIFISSVLQVAVVPVVNAASCSASYSGAITGKMICAGYKEGGTGFCKGDMGGPLVFDNKQIGVASWAEGCGRPNKPGVYARVSVLRNWIRLVSGV